MIQRNKLVVVLYENVVKRVFHGDRLHERRHKETDKKMIYLGGHRKVFTFYNMVIRYYVTLILVLFSMYLMYDARAAENASISNDILYALEKNASDANPITLVWQSNYSTSMDFQKLCEQIKFPDFYGFNEPINQIFMWQDRSFFFHRSHKEFLKKGVDKKEKSPKAWEIGAHNEELTARVDDFAFDGHRFYSGNGPDSPGISSALAILSPTQIRAENIPNLIRNEYSFFLGIKFPMGANEIGDAQMSTVQYLARIGKIIKVVNETLEGENVVTIEIRALNPWENLDRIHKFYLLPKFNYAIKQYDILSVNDKLAYRVCHEDYVRVDSSSLYLPRRTILSYYTFYSDIISSSVLFRQDFHLVKFSSKKIIHSQFDLSNMYSKPGTRIADSILKETPTGLQYDIPANPADLDRVIEAALTEGTFTPTPMASTGAVIVRWLLCIAGLAMILYAGYTKFVNRKT